jgi:hypothetical protein
MARLDNSLSKRKTSAWTCGLGPDDLPAQADDAAREGQTTSEEEPRGHSGGVPAASRQPAEDPCLRCRLAEMNAWGRIRRRTP